MCSAPLKSEECLTYFEAYKINFYYFDIFSLKKNVSAFRTIKKLCFLLIVGHTIDMMTG